MASLPSKRKMERALAEASRAARSMVKEANRAAGRLVSQGDYARSDRFVALAKAIASFQGEIEQLRERWRDALADHTGGGQDRGEKTPLWQYYRPILSALDQLGGSATRNAIEVQLEKTLPAMLKPADIVANARGIPWWRIMIRRSRRAMLKEKFIEAGPAKNWVITEAGRRALTAQGPTKSP